MSYIGGPDTQTPRDEHESAGRFFSERDTRLERLVGEIYGVGLFNGVNAPRQKRLQKACCWEKWVTLSEPVGQGVAFNHP